MQACPASEDERHGLELSAEQPRAALAVDIPDLDRPPAHEHARALAPSPRPHQRADPLLQAVSAGGAALLFEDQIQTTGEVPGTTELRAIGAWLDRSRV